MEDNFLLRFPGIGQDIFNKLDNQNVTKCKEVSHLWNNFLKQSKFVWIRIIHTHQNYYIAFKEDWRLVLTRIPLETAKELAIAVEKFGKIKSAIHPSNLTKTSNPTSPALPILQTFDNQYSPAHIVAGSGSISLWERIAERLADSNPGCWFFYILLAIRHH